MVAILLTVFGLSAWSQVWQNCTGTTFRGRPANVQFTAVLDLSTGLVSNVTISVDGIVVVRSDQPLPRDLAFNNRNNRRFNHLGLYDVPRSVFLLSIPEDFSKGMLWFPLNPKPPVESALWRYSGTQAGYSTPLTCDTKNLSAQLSDAEVTSGTR
jgi:hypothetical protein